MLFKAKRYSVLSGLAVALLFFLAATLVSCGSEGNPQIITTKEVETVNNAINSLANRGFPYVLSHVLAPLMGIIFLKYGVVGGKPSELVKYMVSSVVTLWLTATRYKKSEGLFWIISFALITILTNKGVLDLNNWAHCALLNMSAVFFVAIYKYGVERQNFKSKLQDGATDVVSGGKDVISDRLDDVKKGGSKLKDNLNGGFTKGTKGIKNLAVSTKNFYKDRLGSGKGLSESVSAHGGNVADGIKEGVKKGKDQLSKGLGGEFSLVGNDSVGSEDDTESEVRGTSRSSFTSKKKAIMKNKNFRNGNSTTLKTSSKSETSHKSGRAYHYGREYLGPNATLWDKLLYAFYYIYGDLNLMACGAKQDAVKAELQA